MAAHRLAHHQRLQRAVHDEIPVPLLANPVADYPFAWRVTSVTSLIAAGMVLLARRMFQRDLGARPLAAVEMLSPTWRNS